jgi:CelD/BcsL family acetyltransferase involved in cellulose biosynthesis
MDDLRAISSTGAGTSVLLTDLEALEPIEDEWRALAVARENPHLTPELFRAWANNYEDAARPFVPAVFHPDGRLRGLLPLVITRDRLRQVQFAAANFWMPLHPVAALEDEEEVGAAAGRLLAARRSEWRALTLDNVAAGARWRDALVTALTSDYGRGLVTRRIEHPWLVAETADGWESYLASRSPKFRQELRRIERRLDESHGVSIRESTSAEELRADLETLFRFHSLRRSELGGSTYDEPAMRRTLEEFAGAALARGWLRLRILELDGDDAAANLFFCVGRRCAGYLLSWHPKWAAISLGRIAMADGLRAAATGGAHEFDLSVGRTEFKAQYATSERVVYTTWLYPRRTAALFALRRAARKLLPRVVRRALGRRIRSTAGRVDLPR